ncbi:DUF2867 domain-containing protein [Shimia sp.]|uniref:DUF2867 domain-containing protein n=1 Tax=Shimia sp. TaxID=1954381 RepID=UPI003B8C48E2
MTFSLSQVTAVELPKNSLLQSRLRPDDFVDCYRVKSHLPVREAAEVITAFPAWARLLVMLRNVVVFPFGLKDGSAPEGDKVGFFPVESETDEELIAGFNDRHLNFRVSVMRQDGHVYLATWVHRNNLLGRMYLATVMPFHVLISKDALKRVGHLNA